LADEKAKVRQFASDVVFAPSVPETARKALRERSRRGVLPAASEPIPKGTTLWGFRLLLSIVMSPASAFIAAYGLFIILAIAALFWALVTGSLNDTSDDSNPLAPRWVFVTAAVLGALVGAVLPWAPEGDGAKTMSKYRGRYLSGKDLDDPAHDLLTRAADAVDGVLRSALYRDGLLDRIGNDVVLPQRLWDIAQLVHRQTRLRAEMERAGTRDWPTELKATVTPQLRALKKSVQSAHRQVGQLEKYSRLVARAEQVYAARTMMDDNQKYMDLLAETHDEESVAELTAEARRLARRFAGDLEEAIEAGKVLVLPD
jgi:hypothetical protein